MASAILFGVSLSIDIRPEHLPLLSFWCSRSFWHSSFGMCERRCGLPDGRCSRRWSYGPGRPLLAPDQDHSAAAVHRLKLRRCPSASRIDLHRSNRTWHHHFIHKVVGTTHGLSNNSHAVQIHRHDAPIHARNRDGGTNHNTGRIRLRARFARCTDEELSLGKTFIPLQEDCGETLNHLRYMVWFAKLEILRRHEVAVVRAAFGIPHSPIEPAQVKRHEGGTAGDALFRKRGGNRRHADPNRGIWSRIDLQLFR